jgi:DNA-directed RNA polymerase specialized sigma24 family protein
MTKDGEELDRTVYDKLCQQDWGEIGKELLAFAHIRASNYDWYSSGSDHLAEGKTCEDVVQEVIVKTFTGQRKWDPNKGELLPWLRDQIKSILDALVWSAAHRHETPISEDHGAEGSRERPRNTTSYAEQPFTGQALSPEKCLLEKGEMQKADRKIERLFEEIEEDPELEEVLIAIMDGCEPKPRYLAAELGVRVSEIYNRMKRLRRRALAIREDLHE